MYLVLSPTYKERQRSPDAALNTLYFLFIISCMVLVTAARWCGPGGMVLSSEIIGFLARFFPNCYLLSGPLFSLTGSRDLKDLDIIVVYEWNSENV